MLEQIDTTKAKGADGLGNVFLNWMANVLDKSLKIVFNTIANKHVFPDVWKTAEVVPIYKSGDKQNISNYWGITLLSCTSKVLEKLLFEKLYAVTKDAVLSKDQHRFCQKGSTTNQMIKFLKEINSGLNSGTLVYTLLTLSEGFQCSLSGEIFGKFLLLRFLRGCLRCSWKLSD